MAKLGSLVADLKLQSAAFIRDLGKAKNAVRSDTAKMRQSMRRLETATRGVNRAMKQMRAGAGALAGALAVRQFATFATTAPQPPDKNRHLAATTRLMAEAMGD